MLKEKMLQNKYSYYIAQDSQTNVSLLARELFKGKLSIPKLLFLYYIIQIFL